MSPFKKNIPYQLHGSSNSLYEVDTEYPDHTIFRSLNPNRNKRIAVFHEDAEDMVVAPKKTTELLYAAEEANLESANRAVRYHTGELKQYETALIMLADADE